MDISRADQFTLSEWLRYWLDNYGKVYLRPSSLTNYIGFLDNQIANDKIGTHIHCFISHAMNRAIDEKLISENPASRCIRPKKEQKEITRIDEEVKESPLKTKTAYQ